MRGWRLRYRTTWFMSSLTRSIDQSGTTGDWASVQGSVFAHTAALELCLQLELQAIRNRRVLPAQAEHAGVISGEPLNKL